MTATLDRAAYYARNSDRRALLAALDRFLEAAAHARRERATAGLQRGLAAALGATFAAQGRAFVRRLASLRDQFPAEVAEAAMRRLLGEAAEPDWEPLYDAAASGTVAAFDAALTDVIQQALALGGGQVLAQLGIADAFDLAAPDAVAYVEQHGAELVTRINAITKTILRNVIATGVENGDSYATIATAIGRTFADMAGDRARLIATTEIGNAYEQGNMLAAQRLKDAGLEMEKSWLTAGADDECLDNEQAGWIPLDDPFPSGDMQPLAHPNCRCVALYRRKPGEEGA